MSTVQLDRAREATPLVVLVSSVPLLTEALAGALDGIVEVRAFPARRGDLVGLLDWLNADAVVVDTLEESDAARSFARRTGAPVVHVTLREGKLRVLRNGDWIEAPDADCSVESIRNVLLGSLFGRKRGR